MTDDQATPDLLDRIGDLNRTRLLPTIERVLMEFDRPDTVIRIDRLDLKLGTISPNDLDAATARLETSLREALSAAIANSTAASEIMTQVVEAKPTDGALLHALAGYLRNGTWPYRKGAAADPITLLVGLSHREPDGVRRLIADAVAEPDAAERLALQLTADDLRQLGTLVPKQAARILASLPDGNGGRSARLQAIRTIAEAAQPPGDAATRQLSPPNEQIVAAAPQSVRSTAAPASLMEFSDFLEHGALPRGGPDALLLTLANHEAVALVRMLHQRGRDHATLRRLAETLATTTLGRLLRLLTPAASDIIVAHMAEVRDVQRQRPVVSLAERSLERQLWFVALRHVLNDAGTQFNRRTFVAHMIAELADAEQLSYRTMLRVFATSLAGLMDTTPAATSLAAIILELAHAPDPRAVPDTPAPLPANDAEPDIPRAAVVTSAAAYRDLDRLRHLLTTAALPWQDLIDEPTLTPEGLIARLRQLRPGLVLNALQGRRLDRGQVRHTLDLLPEATVSSLLALLRPADTQAHVPVRAALERSPSDAIAVWIDRLPSTGPHALADDPAPKPSRKPPDAVAARLAALAVATANGMSPKADGIDTLVLLAHDHPAMARRFLARTMARETTWARIARAVGEAEIHALLKALAPTAAAPLIQLAQALAAAGQRHGLRHQDTTAALLFEVVSSGGETTVSAALLQRVLERLAASGAARGLAEVRDDLRMLLPRPIADLLQPVLGAEHGPSARALSDRAQKLDAPGTSTGRHTEWLFQALAACDLSRAAPRDEAPELLNELMQAILAQTSRDPILRLLAFLSRAPNNAQLIRLLPERQLALLILRARPHAGPDLLDAAELLTEAAGPALDRTIMWQSLFETAAAPANRSTVADLARRLVAAAGHAAPGASPAERTAASTALVRAAMRLARDAGHAPLRAALDSMLKPLTSPRAPATQASAAITPAQRPAGAQQRRTSFRMAGGEEASQEPIFIDNAGLVLTNPFLPHLFEALGLLTRDERGKPRLRDEAAASRAVHLLQYLVDGRTDAPEPLLALNKVLCGLPIAAPVDRAITLTDDEHDTCDMLLRSILGNWPILSGTSIAGLRETFLQRDGKLTLTDGAWRLQVQRKTLDVLVDQIPWSIGVVFHAWMPGALHVTW